MKKEETKKGIYKNLLTGALSSGIARTIMNPLERIEILRQTQNFDYKNLSFFQSVIKMYKTQGVKGFFKGNTASLMRVLPYSAIEFCSVEFSKNILRFAEKTLAIYGILWYHTSWLRTAGVERAFGTSHDMR